jgi:signal transduction histidine kinase
MDRRAAICVIACGIALLAWITAPDTRPFGTRLVAPADMIYFPGDRVGQPVPVAEGQAQLTATAKNTPKNSVMRQLHFGLPADDGVSVYVPSSPDDAALWVNGMVGGDSAVAAYFGPGFGPHRMSIEIPESRLGFENNRMDILLAQGWAKDRMPLIYVTPTRTGPAFAVMAEQAETRLRQGALGFGGLGLLLSLAGMFFLRSRLLYTGGALFSLALFDQAFGVLPAWLRIGIAVIGIAVLIARKAWQYPLLGGALIAAAAAVLAGIALTLGWAASLPFLWSINAGLWPLAGMAMPLLALTEGRSVWGEFVAARIKIREQALLIEQQQSELQDSIRAQAVSEERQRFVRDMHDGVGGHLLSLLMRVRADDADSNDIAEELEKGLTDLRLMADSLDHVGQDLDAALAAFHRRAAQQLASAGLAFDWSNPQALNNFRMDTRAVLSLYRIIQEALSNCIRHAHASRFGVSFNLADDGARLDVVIQDDGTGFAPGTIEEGRGLGNIRARAEKLDGTVVFETGDKGKGCRIRLSVPGG